MTNAVGRPIAPLVLSSGERAYLERQVRRRRVARSLSERCRVILRCADGVPSKSLANVTVVRMAQRRVLLTGSYPAHCPYRKLNPVGVA
jgi:hypothetical protein